MASPEGKLMFSKWKYRHYFNHLCTCPLKATLSTPFTKLTLAKTLLLMMIAGQVWLTCAPLTASQKLVAQTELNAMIDRYVVKNLLPLSTVDSDSFRALIRKMLGRACGGPP